MTESITPTPESTATSRAAQIGWILLIGATLYICYFSHLGAIGFVGPDEPRYAWIARDMMETGDWVTPRLYGKPWFEKPPLFYWAAGLSFKLFGVSEAAARLPSAVSALLATLALAWLALQLYGAETARWVLLLLPTTVGMIGFSHAAATDMPFSAMLTIGMVCAAVVLGLTRDEHTPILPRMPWLALILFGFFLGLAALAKGPAALVLSGGAVLFWALFTKRWRDAFRLLHPAAVASFCMTALPWYIFCARRNPDFFRVFIIEHNFKRYVTSEFQHAQPLWFYVPILLIGLVPWALLFVFKSLMPDHSLWKRTSYDSRSCFFLSWSLFTVVFFTLSWSKLPGYILPAIPPLVFLLLPPPRFVIQSIKDSQLQHASFYITSIAFCVWALGCSLWGSWMNRQIPDTLSEVGIPRDFVLLLKIVSYIGLIALATCIYKRKPHLSLVVTALVAIVLVEGANRMLLPWLDRTYSTRELAGSFVHTADPNLPVYSFKLRRNYEYGLAYYLHRGIEEWDPNLPGPGYIVYSESASRELPWTELRLVTVGIDGPAGLRICLKSKDSSEPASQ